MDYDKAKQYLTAIGCELLTRDEFASRTHMLYNDNTYFFPYGCGNCEKAGGISDFTDVLFAIYPKTSLAERDGEIEQRELGIGFKGGVQYTSIARCKFCGDCKVIHEVRHQCRRRW